ncbi:type II secretion system protein N [Pseudomonas sp.]|uniref:type II secretion system protein N n=1 Tax=Pseudomonas sp. TaxID=306 RepID=UPI003A973EEA
MNAFFRAGGGLPKAVLVSVTLLYGIFLAGQEWRFRQEFRREVPMSAAPVVVQSGAALNVQAVASVLGLASREATALSAEPITLQASFVNGGGLSRALLADATGPRIYQVGERLPGGSVLRRVDATHVVLWRNGREERVALQRTGEPFLRRLPPGSGGQPPSRSSQYLHPVAGLSE